MRRLKCLIDRASQGDYSCCARWASQRRFGCQIPLTHPPIWAASSALRPQRPNFAPPSDVRTAIQTP
jgi:hypothetical protein